MIEISYKKNKLINEVKISGHALYDTKGKDIVCSAVSSISTTVINCILTLDENAIEYESDSGFILIINHDNEMASKLLDTMIKMFEELALSYPKNIKIGG